VRACRALVTVCVTPVDPSFGLRKIIPQCVVAFVHQLCCYKAFIDVCGSEEDNRHLDSVCVCVVTATRRAT